jgi:hypothetical protein
MARRPLSFSFLYWDVFFTRPFNKRSKENGPVKKTKSQERKRTGHVFHVSRGHGLFPLRSLGLSRPSDHNIVRETDRRGAHGPWTSYRWAGPMHVFFQPKGWRFTKKTHASSPSTSGKTHEKTCPIQTRRETRESIPETLPCDSLDAWRSEACEH